MKKLQTVKSLSLMSTKPMGLMQLKKRDVLSFSEMILKRILPTRLSIKNDTVRFFLKQANIETSVVHHQHSYKEEHSQYTLVKNINNHLTDNMMIQNRNIENRINNFNTQLINKHFIKINHNNSQSTIFQNKLSNFKNFSYKLNKEKNKEELNSEITKKPLKIRDFLQYEQHNKTQVWEKQEVPTFQVYKKNHIENSNTITSLKSFIKDFTVNTNIALKNNFSTSKSSNILTFQNQKNHTFSLQNQSKNMNINTDTQHKVFTNLQNRVEKHKQFLETEQNIHNTEVEVQIIYKQEKKESSTNVQETKQVEHEKREVLQTNNALSTINKSIENSKIFNTQQEELVQIISHKVIKKIETIWSREHMRRGGNYGI